MTDTMLEKAARAIFDAAPFRDAEGPYESQTETYRALCRSYARAALEAIREPSEAARQAAFDRCDGFVHEHDIPRVWQTILDAILSEKP